MKCWCFIFVNISWADAQLIQLALHANVEVEGDWHWKSYNSDHHLDLNQPQFNKVSCKNGNLLVHQLQSLLGKENWKDQREFIRNSVCLCELNVLHGVWFNFFKIFVAWRALLYFVSLTFSVNSFVTSFIDDYCDASVSSVNGNF